MKLLFLSVPTGQGHNQAAKALEEYYRGMDGIECQTLDVFDNVNPLLSESIEKGYLISTKMTPKVYGTFYDICEKRDQTKYSSVGKLVKSVLNKQLMKYIESYQPDIIVAMHIFSAIAISYLRKKYPIKAKTLAIVTDFTIHPFWEDVDIDYYITATELLEWQTDRKGYPREKVKPFGIPIMPKFAEKMPQADARKELGLDSRFTILLMMGSMGYGNDTMDIISRLDNMSEDFQIITVCGNNKKLKAQIDAMEKKKRFINYGFTHNVDVLMDAADCIITKPGGLSTSEALAKELPIIMLDPIPGQEDRNEEFMLNNGIAISLSDTYTVDEAIYQLIHFGYRLDQLKQNMKYIAKPNSTRDLGEFMLTLCGENGKK